MPKPIVRCSTKSWWPPAEGIRRAAPAASVNVFWKIFRIFDSLWQCRHLDCASR